MEGIMTDTNEAPQGATPPAEPPASPPAAGQASGGSAPEKRPGSGGVTFGLLLVVLGVVLIGARLIPGIGWLSGWPLIICAFGAVEVFRAKDLSGVIDGAGTVTIGGILLMNTLGRLPWAIWMNVLSLWPLLLIAAGAAIVSKAVGQKWLRVAGQLLLLGGLLYAALVMPAGSWHFPIVRSLNPSGPTQSFTQAAPSSIEASHATALIEWGAADITVKSGSALAEISGVAPAGFSPKLDVSEADGTAAVRVGLDTGTSGGAETSTMDVVLGRSVAWSSVAVKAGAAEIDADLSDLEVEVFELDMGATASTITLGEKARSVRARIAGGVADVTVRVPKGAEVVLRSQGPIVVSMPDGFTRTRSQLFDETWERRPEGAETSIDITVAGGIMNVRVETY
jgi:hypothetical protein